MKKKALIITMCCVLLFSFLIPVFASNIDVLIQIPNDISDNVYTYGTLTSNLTKLYAKISIGNVPSLDNNTILLRINVGTAGTGSRDLITYLNTGLKIGSNGTSSNSIISIPIIFINDYNNTTIYVPIYLYNSSIHSVSLSEYVTLDGLYYSILDDPNVIANELYRIGYDSGYNQGYADGALGGVPEDLNLVQHINKAVGFFIGDQYAPYVTPFAIAFTLLIAYFIFIRWILMFNKSSKAMHIADIIVVAACIGIMAVMYINMFTINIHNTNVTESVYQIASDVVTGG